MILTKRGFTLVELLVVIAMIAIISGAMTSSISSAQQRARIQKATSDVKVISQAILGYENINKAGESYKLPTMKDQDADKGNLSFLLGNGTSTESGDKLVLLMASMRGGKILDPWGTPYAVTIKEGKVETPKAMRNLYTGYSLPNLNRLSAGERGL